MNEFYYHKLQPYYNKKIELLYMDTDSFILSITTTNLLKDLNYFENHFDFSELDKDHQFNDFKKSCR